MNEGDLAEVLRGGPADLEPERRIGDRPATRRYNSVGAASGVLGVMLLMLGTALHPVPADGNDAAVAFGVYAEVSRSVWLAAHLQHIHRLWINRVRGFRCRRAALHLRLAVQTSPPTR